MMDKLDVLNRDEFVEKLVGLVKNIADNKTSTCFAIDGVWGCGKSFVIIWWILKYFDCKLL